MTPILKSTALIFLVLISIFTGVGFFSPAGSHVAKATPNDIKLQEASISCLNPRNMVERVTCANLEAQILDVTIRIEMHSLESYKGHLKSSVRRSHATIMDGKYLVTHNHFRYSLRRQVGAFGDQNGYTGISLRTTGGRLLLENAPLNSFRIVHEDPETLVLAFLDENGNGLFEAAGLPSAHFVDIKSIPLETGDELAQIDWDGEIVHVDWVTVDILSLNGEVPQLQVDNYPKKGCSGGGVFWNGIHIGNTWSITIKKNPETKEVTRRYSTVALNPSMLMDDTQ